MINSVKTGGETKPVGFFCLEMLFYKTENQSHTADDNDNDSCDLIQ